MKHSLKQESVVGKGQKINSRLGELPTRNRDVRCEVSVQFLDTKTENSAQVQFNQASLNIQ